MRACEFVLEAREGKIGKRRQHPTRGLNLFYDGDHINSDYTLNRVMMAAASTDGKTMPDIDATSWAGKYRTAHPYTQEEQDMLNMAYRAVGAVSRDLNRGDMRSQELESTNVASPLKPFKGYR